jgi:hypothetical protein
MKKIIFSTVVMAMVVLSSCVKNPVTNLHVNQVGGGTWTFAGTTDSATSCLYGPGQGSNSAMSGSNYSSSTGFTGYTTIRCGFLDTLYAGTYTAVATTTNPGRNQMNFEIDYGIGGTNGASWYSTGRGPNQTVTVAISGNTVTITGTGITINNSANQADTSVLSFRLYSPYN